VRPGISTADIIACQRFYEVTMIILIYLFINMAEPTILSLMIKLCIVQLVMKKKGIARQTFIGLISKGG
jgi:hypothetical protein